MNKRLSKRSGWRMAASAAMLAAGLSLAACAPKTIPQETMAKNERERGIARYNLGEYEEAREYFQSSINYKPMGFRQNYWLGMTELKLGRPVEAQTALELAYTVRQDDPDWTPKILDALAESLYQQGRLDALQTMLGEASTRYGTAHDHLREARYLVKTGDMDGALLAYRKAANVVGKSDPEPYIEIADFYISINDVPNATKALRYAYWVDPGNEEVANRFRKLGVVPGPSLQLEPPKPDMLKE